jgi:hypothetical protein
MPNRPNFPIPAVIDPPRKCLCIEIPFTDDHKRVFAGLIWELTEWFNWQRDTEESGRQLAAVYRDVFSKIDWSDMSCCCGEQKPPIRRVNPDDNTKTQISTDGGVTWVDDPLDPAVSGSVLPPPITAGVSATKCDAATNGRQHVTDFVAKVQEVITAGGVVWSAIDAVVIFLVGLFLLDPATIPAIVPVLIGLFSIAFALTGTVWTDYFTSDVYDKITCALFCNMEADGSFTDGDASAVFAKMEMDLPSGVQKDFLLLVLRNQGAKGLNNMCAYGGTADADCSSCDCSDACPDISSFTEQLVGVLGTIIARDDRSITVQANYYSGDTNYYASINTGSSSICCVVKGFPMISGTKYDNFNWSTCGHNPLLGTDASGANPLDISVNGIYASSNVPFTIKFEFGT